MPSPILADTTVATLGILLPPLAMLAMWSIRGMLSSLKSRHSWSFAVALCNNQHLPQRQNQLAAACRWRGLCGSTPRAACSLLCTPTQSIGLNLGLGVAVLEPMPAIAREPALHWDSIKQNIASLHMLLFFCQLALG